MRLPLAFDATALTEDQARIEAAGWTDHFVRQNHTGSWSVVPLRAGGRNMRLTPGSRIHQHSDPDLAAEAGIARIHIVVTTDPDVEFLVNGRAVAMAAGECWYLRLSNPHSVSNGGATDRVHLVVDCLMDEWLEEVLKAGEGG